MKVIALLVLGLAPLLSFAEESWGGHDKKLHAVAGGVTGALAYYMTKKPEYGCMAAAAVGLAKEISDAQHVGNQASGKDFVVTTLAGCLVSYGSNMYVEKNQIVWRKYFE